MLFRSWKEYSEVRDELSKYEFMTNSRNIDTSIYDSIINACCEVYRCTSDMLFGGNQTHNVAWAKYTACALFKEYTQMSVHDLSVYFNYKDHTTVSKGLKKYYNHIDIYPDIKEKYELAKSKLLNV